MCAPTRDDLSPYGIGGGGRDVYKDNPTKQAAYDAEVAKNQAKLKEGGYEMPVGFRVREPMDMVTGPFGQGLSQALWSKKYDEENPSITMSAPAIDNPAPTAPSSGQREYSIDSKNNLEVAKAKKGSTSRNRRGNTGRMRIRRAKPKLNTTNTNTAAAGGLNP